MADFKVAIDFHSAATSPGNQVLPLTCEGEPIAGVILDTVEATSYKIGVGRFDRFIGFTDGAVAGCQTASSQTGVGASNSKTAVWNDRIGHLFNPGTSTVYCRANVVSIGIDQLTINWTVAPSTTFLMRTTAFYGTAAQAAVFVNLLDDSEVLTHNFGTTNHHIYLGLGSVNQGAVNTVTNSGAVPIGIGRWPGSGVPSHITVNYQDRDGRGESEPYCIVDDTDFLIYRTAAAAINTRFDLTAADPNSVTIGRSLGTANRASCVMAIDLGSSGSDLTLEAITAGVTWTKTGLPWQPGALFIPQTKVATKNVDQVNNASAEAISIGVSSKWTDNAGVQAVGVDQGAGTTVTEGIEYGGTGADIGVAAIVDGGTGLIAVANSKPTYNTDGYTVTFDTVPGGSYLWPVLSIEDQDAGTGPGPIERTASFSGVGTLNATSEITIPRTASLSGVGTLNAAYELVGGVLERQATLSGLGTLNATYQIIGTINRQASLAGVGTLNATYLLDLDRSASMSGVGTLNASYILGGVIPASASFLGFGTLNARYREGGWVEQPPAGGSWEEQSQSSSNWVEQ